MLNGDPNRTPTPGWKCAGARPEITTIPEGRKTIRIQLYCEARKIKKINDLIFSPVSKGFPKNFPT